MAKTLSAKIKEIARENSFEFDVKFNQISERNELWCKLCTKKVTVDIGHLSSQVKAHCGGAKHRRNFELNKPRQPFIDNALHSADRLAKESDQFNLRLTRALISAGIPLHVLKNKELKDFLQIEMKRVLPSVTSLRQVSVPKLYDIKIEEIREFVGENDIYLVMDETTDACNRYVLNIMIGILDGKSFKTYLLFTSFLESTKNKFIVQQVNNALQLLWKNGIKYERFVLLLSDQGSNMVAAAQLLKTFFPKLHHITCLVHSLNRVCELIKDNHPLVNSFNSSIKKIFCKSPYRKKLFQETCQISLPPISVLSRWNTWLEASFYMIDNFDVIKSFIEALGCDSKSIKKAQFVLKKKEFEEELLDLQQFRFLTKKITEMQGKFLTMKQQFDLFNSAKDNLNGEYKEKINFSLSRNPDLKRFIENQDFTFRLKTTCAPLTTVDVERSFSQYKSLLSENRRKFSEENIIKYHCIQHNCFINDENE